MILKEGQDMKINDFKVIVKDQEDPNETDTTNNE